MSSELRPSHTEMVEKYLEGCKNKSVTHYMLTISRDGEDPVRSILFYNDVVEAVQGYEMYQDAGFASRYLTITLYEPTGRVNSKILQRNQAGDPSFVRQNYIDVTNALLELKDKLDKKDYEDACIKICTSFGKDNWRFNTERFLENLKIEKVL
jgi:hypothetical protein